MMDFKLLVLGSLLYMCFSRSDASFAKISSVASSVIEETVPSYLQVSHFLHGQQTARTKREVVSTTLNDPKSCVSYCRSNMTFELMTTSISNMGRLLSVALTGITGDEVSTPEKEAALKKRVEEQTIANMGPFFDDLCKVANHASSCYSKCPDSKLRSIITADSEGTAAAFCEPGKNWKNFTDYWNAVNCTNSTEIENPCEKKCGRDQSIKNVTHLEIDDDMDALEMSESSVESDKHTKARSDHGVSVKYEDNAKKNTASVGPVCKLISCQLDCYKPLMTKKCGAKAYDMYNRMTKVEPQVSLKILKTLGAVNSNSDCGAYQ